jgi:DNA mismatch endonuclease, patch repair protein
VVSYFCGMADVHDRETRRKNMGAIKYKDTKPEMIVRRFLFSKGFRYRLHVAKLPGKPDIVLKKHKTIVEVYGCYFHRHNNCKFCTTPADTSTTDWKTKFEKNTKRDRLNQKALKKLGWKLLIVWECQLKPKKVMKTLTKLPGKIVSSKP